MHALIDGAFLHLRNFQGSIDYLSAFIATLNAAILELEGLFEQIVPLISLEIVVSSLGHSHLRSWQFAFLKNNLLVSSSLMYVALVSF